MMATDTAQALTPTAPAAAEPAPPEGASAKLPKSASKKQKLTTEPHGYLADKLATFVRAVKTLSKKLRKDKEKAAAAGGEAKTTSEAAAAPGSAESAAGVASASPEAQSESPATALPPTPPPAQAQAAQESPSPVTGLIHRHEPADQLHEPLSTVDKLKNAVISTVEHAVDEADAVQSSLAQTGQAVMEEVGKFRHEAHEQQLHPQQGPVTTTTGGLPLTEK